MYNNFITEIVEKITEEVNKQIKTRNRLQQLYLAQRETLQEKFAGYSAPYFFDDNGEDLKEEEI